MDVQKTRAFVDRQWEQSVVPTIEQYIRIPNESPAFDPDWEKHGHMLRAAELAAAWVREQGVAGLKQEIVRLPGRTPLLFIEVPGDPSDTVLLYGHLDKQPPFEGWSDGLGAWTPVRRGDRLYGRGGADDGYAVFAALTALRALQDQGARHARAVLVIECGEESGSPDLPAYIDHLSGRVGTPSLIVCLDSGCGDYDRLWLTSSLRGLVNGTLRVGILREGVHSGSSSGIVPSSFRILRQLLARLEDEKTGEVLLRDAWVEVPPHRLEEAGKTAALLGKGVHAEFPFVPGARPVTADLKELVLNRTWRPQLAVTGAAGFPPPDKAGNVLRPWSVLRLSLRVPPRRDPKHVLAKLKELLEKDPPYGAEVRFEPDQAASGWDAPALEPWLDEALVKASRDYFGNDVAFIGEGGTIPFMAMLGERFPRAQFVITGVLGPGSNAHGPNEFLHVPTGKGVTSAVAAVLAAHAARNLRA